MAEESQGAIERPHPFVESESATTDHEHNRGNVATVIVPLIIVGFLALFTYLALSILATSVATYAKSQMGTRSFGYEYDYDDYGDLYGDLYDGYEDPYYDGYLDNLEYNVW